MNPNQVDPNNQAPPQPMVQPATQQPYNNTQPQMQTPPQGTMPYQQQPFQQPAYGPNPQNGGFQPMPSGSVQNSNKKLFIFLGLGAVALLIFGGIIAYSFNTSQEMVKDAADKAISDSTDETSGGTTQESSTSENNQDTATQNPEIQKVGKSFSVKAATLAFNVEVLQYERGVISKDTYNTPYEDTNEFMMVKIRVTNKSTKADNIYTNSFYITDENGDEYARSYAYSDSNEGSWGNRKYFDGFNDIPVGKTQIGYIMYEVPKDAKSLSYNLGWKVTVIGGTNVDEVKTIKLF
jgi:hypothetical protein